MFGNTTIPRDLVDVKIGKLNSIERSNTKTNMEIEYNVRSSI